MGPAASCRQNLGHRRCSPDYKISPTGPSVQMAASRFLHQRAFGRVARSGLNASKGRPHTIEDISITPELRQAFEAVLTILDLEAREACGGSSAEALSDYLLQAMHPRMGIE